LKLTMTQLAATASSAGSYGYNLQLAIAMATAAALAGSGDRSLLRARCNVLQTNTALRAVMNMVRSPKGLF